MKLNVPFKMCSFHLPTPSRTRAPGGPGYCFVGGRDALCHAREGHLPSRLLGVRHCALSKVLPVGEARRHRWQDGHSQETALGRREGDNIPGEGEGTSQHCPSGGDGCLRMLSRAVRRQESGACGGRPDPPACFLSLTPWYHKG